MLLLRALMLWILEHRPYQIQDYVGLKKSGGGISEPLLYTYMPHGGGIQRDSTAVRAVGAVLQKMPTSLFQHLSPYLLKWVT
jgi:hypothetical protein